MKEKTILTLILCGLAAVIFYAAVNSNSDFDRNSDAYYASRDTVIETCNRFSTEMVLSQFMETH